MINKVTAARLKEMKVGDSVVFTEPMSRNIGKATQSYAIRAGVKVTTKLCLVVIPATAETIRAVIVKRVA